MNVGIAIHNDFPDDVEVRTRKIAKYLDDQGHSVTIFARNEHDQSKREQLDYAKVHRFSWLQSTPLFDLITVPIPLNPLWLIWLLIEFRRQDIDLVIGCGIRAGLPSVIAGSLLSLPTIFDLRENNSELVKLLPKQSIGDYFKQNPFVNELIERVCLHFADKTWVVVEERKTGLIEQGMSPERLAVVGNTPYFDELEEFDKGRSEFNWPGFTLVYVGHITHYRGLDRVLEAMSEVVALEKDISVAIAGDGPYKTELEQKVMDLNLEDHVFFTGWIPAENVPGFIESGDVGLVPHDVNSFTNTTAPNKLFDYMMMGVPVLATEMAPVERIVRETGCGEVVPSNSSPNQMTHSIISMKKQGLNRMGRKGQEAISRTYNWERSAETILESIEELKS